MLILPLIINAVVIVLLCAELVAIAFGKIGHNQLLITSALSGLLVLVSVTLAKVALPPLDSDSSLADEAAQTPAKDPA